MPTANEMLPVGWKEWVYLPDLDIGPLKAKIDTGARTSALHAYDIQVDGDVVRFKVHTIQGRDDFFIQAEAPFIGDRLVRDSHGNSSLRPAISTTLRMAGLDTTIECTLIARETQKFRMLIGRSVVAGKYLVDCSTEYCGGVPDAVRHWESP